MGLTWVPGNDISHGEIWSFQQTAENVYHSGAAAPAEARRPAGHDRGMVDTPGGSLKYREKGSGRNSENLA